LAALYYRGVDCAVIVYDITSRVSFDQVKEYWIHELRHQCFGAEGLQIAIIGNKAGINLC
jgi:Ras-related protein Rab-5C